MNRSALMTILNALLFVIVLSVAGMVVALSRQQQLGGLQLMVVKSGSMAPALPTGSMVVTQRADSYHVGDVVTFREPGTAQRLITHRIVGKEVINNQPVFYTRGDANNAVDTVPVPYSSVVGKLQFTLPLIGYFLSFLQTPVGVIALVVIPGTILCYEELRKLKANLKNLGKAAAMVVLVLGMVVLPQSTWASYAGQTTIQGMVFTTHEWLPASLSLNLVIDTLEMRVSNAAGYDEAEYQVTYSHEVEGTPVTEQVVGTATKLSADTLWYLPEVYLGTCSSEGLCTPHQNVSNVQVEVQLKSTGLIKKTLTQSL